ncbi:cytochrome c oxidase assembly factor 1 family protein [Luteimonas sp. BDR2-5]|uniref:cytochrome c oxidase assembly factor Coa1 family protein n=1 Tax=Proluteimonas luteida TaxID=2878685 RepID=UPI001E333911|nr:cytochrome c oxidase assembly factor Coa1 family protein [Luteimonas sp. BDR2-5]MCD9027276.1 cytochrome c oxidase assembly factor 1 family protein [Luteimonas sp. BDR2-5]
MPLTVVVAFAVVAGGVGTLVLGVRTSMRSSEVYTGAVAQARAHPGVIAALGEPIEEGFMPFGSVDKSSSDGGSGKADLMITLIGPKGRGMLSVDASRSQRQWTYRNLLFVGQDQKIVWLVQNGEPVAPDAVP